MNPLFRILEHIMPRVRMDFARGTGKQPPPSGQKMLVEAEIHSAPQDQAGKRREFWERALNRIEGRPARMPFLHWNIPHEAMDADSMRPGIVGKQIAPPFLA